MGALTKHAELFSGCGIGITVELLGPSLKAPLACVERFLANVANVELKEGIYVSPDMDTLLRGEFLQRCTLSSPADTSLPLLEWSIRYWSFIWVGYGLFWLV